MNNSELYELLEKALPILTASADRTMHNVVVYEQVQYAVTNRPKPEPIDRDAEHIEEMRRSYESVTDDMKQAILLHALVEEVGLSDEAIESAASVLTRDLGLNGPDGFDIYEYVGKSILSLKYTGLPMSGGNTRGEGNCLRAEEGEYYVVILFAYGGPSYAIRARFYGDRLTDDIVFVYHDWFVGYEMDVPAEDMPVWERVVEMLADGLYTAEEIERMMRENGEFYCVRCDRWYDDSEGNADTEECDECRGEDEEDEEDEEFKCEECRGYFSVDEGDGTFCDDCIATRAHNAGVE